GQTRLIGWMFLERFAKRRRRVERRQHATDPAGDEHAAARVEGERKIAGDAAEQTQKRIHRAARGLLPKPCRGKDLLARRYFAAQNAMQTNEAGTRKQLLDDHRSFLLHEMHE